MKIRKFFYGLMFVLFCVQNGAYAEPAKEFYLENGMKIISNFLFAICGAAADYTMDDYIETQIHTDRWMKRMEQQASRMFLSI